MRLSKLTMVMAFAMVLGFATLAFAGPLSELDGGNWWWLYSNKAGEATGWQHDVNTKVTVDGTTAIKTTRTLFEKKGNKTVEMEFVRSTNQPMHSFTMKVEGKTVTGKPVEGGYEIMDGANKIMLKKGDFDYFSYDEQEILNNVPEKQAKEFKIFCFKEMKVVKVTYKNEGSEKIQVQGNDIDAGVYNIVEGTSLTRWWVAKKTLAMMKMRNENADNTGKRVKMEEVKKAFPNAK
ncbi:MAG: hypothetical protein GX444_17040 [Myxococcales bacterium]|nr:hypothetical protein [Myxococcales bacterium]